MHFLDKLEQKLGRFALPNVTLALIVCQVIVYLMIQAKPEALERLYLVPDKVLAGEYWRLFSFLCVPPFTNVLFAFFFWYLFYLMGTALELNWGSFRYDLFLLIGYLATVGVAFLTPGEHSSNAFLQGSVFLAFAYLFPDFVMYLFFILPVKIKWLALLTWISYFVTVIVGDWRMRLLVLASVCNFLLFFSRDIIQHMVAGRRHMATQVRRLSEKDKPFHRCTICGLTDRADPKMDFRYCTKCAGTCCYCSEHLRNHEHISKGDQIVGK